MSKLEERESRRKSIVGNMIESSSSEGSGCQNENFAKKPLHSSGKSDRIPLLTLKTEWKR